MSASEPDGHRDRDRDRDWDWSHARTLRPELRLEAHAPVGDVLVVLDDCLKRAGFRIGERQAAGFQARFVNWWALAVNDLERTTVLVSAVASPGSATEVLVAVVRGAEHRRASQRAARGLASAVQQLQERHLGVTTTGWTAAGSP